MSYSLMVSGNFRRLFFSTVQRKYTDWYFSLLRVPDQTTKVYVLPLCAVSLLVGVSFELELRAIIPLCHIA